MIAIVLKTSSFKRVATRLRRADCSDLFPSLPSRVSHNDDGFTYLYFQSLSDMCYASDYLYAFNAVFRVVETSL